MGVPAREFPLLAARCAPWARVRATARARARATATAAEGREGLGEGWSSPNCRRDSPILLESMWDGLPALHQARVGEGLNLGFALDFGSGLGLGSGWVRRAGVVVGLD